MKRYFKLGAMAIVCSAVLAGCAAPPSSPAEKYARMGVAGDIAVQQCSAYVGGYQAAKSMKADSAKSLEVARKLGATPNMIAKARADVTGTLQGAIIMVGERDACNRFLTTLAFAGS